MANHASWRQLARLTWTRTFCQCRAASELGIPRRARPTLAMSRRRKHVRELVDEPCPELGAGDAVCRVVELRGGNHIEARPRPRHPTSTAAAALPPRHPNPRPRVPASHVA